MMHQSAPPPPSAVGAGHQLAQLRHVLELVEQLSGSDHAGARDEAALEEAARISSACDCAEPLVRRRFDTLAGETAAWAAAGVEALLATHSRGNPPRAAAARLAAELRRALGDLGNAIGARLSVKSKSSRR